MKRNDTVTVVISTKVKDENYISHVKKMFSHPKNQYLVYENDNKYSLSQIYNKGLEESENDIVIFIHDDLELRTKNITPKIIKIFEKNQEYGIIGVAGTDNLTNGKWWSNREDMYGVVSHLSNNKEHTNKYSKDRYYTNLKEVVIVDGLFMAIDKTRIKKTFNEEFKGFHFYDIPICVENYMEGVKIGVTTKFNILHKSVGNVDKNWERGKLFFEAIYGNKLPLKV